MLESLCDNNDLSLIVISPWSFAAMPICRAPVTLKILANVN